MIINIEPGTFGGPLRMGDLVGVCNVVAYLRVKYNQPSLRFFLKPGTINQSEHCLKFHSWLIAHTDYLSAFEGNESLPWRRVNLWDYRDISGDHVKFQNYTDPKKKIVICPVFDAPYNTYRNWPKQEFEEQIKFYHDVCKDYEKIICISNKSLLPCEVPESFKISTDFLENLQHIMESERYIGGDTGTSHFAWSLDRGPKDLCYVNSSRGLMHTMPFYLLSGKGRASTYWLDFEGTSW
jgi:ADP-heptose:LPS heptosyltransferase